MSRSIYLVLPDWQGDPDHADESVVKPLPHGPRYLAVAIELWRLAGDPERASQIEEIIARGYARDNLVLNTEEIEQMKRLLSGLGDALRRSIVDSECLIRPECMAEVRSRSEHLDLREARGDLARYAVSEATGDVAALEEFLTEALSRKLHVALD